MSRSIPQVLQLRALILAIKEASDCATAGEFKYGPSLTDQIIDTESTNLVIEPGNVTEHDGDDW